MHQPIHRRTMLKAVGISLALPLLESMNPVFAKEETKPPSRMVFICTALGLHPPNLWPEKGGVDYESTPYLDLLRDHREDFTLFSGLSHRNQGGRQPHDSEMTWLTGAEKPGMDGFRNSISVDQFAASRLGYVTRFPSVSLGTMKAQSQSYTNGGVMVPAQTSPANLFSQMFLSGNPADVKAQKRRLNEGRSILDELGAQASQVRRKASDADNHLLDDYFDSVRETEANLQEVAAWMDKPKPVVDVQPPTDVLDARDLLGRTRLLMEMVPLIIQTDSSRIISLMIQDHYNVPKVEGVSANHHNLSHHGQDESKIEQLERIEKGITRCFSGLLSEMKQKSETGSRLLDNTSILFGSNLGNANAHDTENLPIVLAGGGFEHRGYVKHKEGESKPLSNLFLTLLNQSGIETESFGESTGAFDW